jgi:hypothetical protein
MNSIDSTISLATTLQTKGFAFLHGSETSALFAEEIMTDDWAAFAASWDDLKTDEYMADGGRYRRRRFAVYVTEPGGQISRAAHQPHYQARSYNQLNGGIERWFEPITETTSINPAFTALLSTSRALFDRLAATPAWHIEAHQFRIEAGPGGAGQPTPEGMHRDGVDYVLVSLIRRQNIEQGTTTIHDLNGQALGSFTLTNKLDSALVDDRLVFHGVTAVTPTNPALPAFRDVLVLTFRKL